MTRTSIEWTRGADGTEGYTWNPIRARNVETGGVGHYCEKVSPGCAGCYAERMQPRFKNKIRYNAADRHKVELFLDEETLREPLHWRTPRNVFPCSMTDLFGGFVPDEWIDRVFAVMALTPQHTYQMLTKRAGRLLDYIGATEEAREARKDAIGEAAFIHHEVLFSGAPDCGEDFRFLDWPLPNLWAGVSVENQDEADKRLPFLQKTPAAVRWLSIEPLLGPVDISLHLFGQTSCGRPDWVVVGGESGAKARPMLPDWVRSLREQCEAAHVPFFFKQWGQFLPVNEDEPHDHYTLGEYGEPQYFRKVRKKKDAGRLLDGQTWDQFPTV